MKGWLASLALGALLGAGLGGFAADSAAVGAGVGFLLVSLVAFPVLFARQLQGRSFSSGRGFGAVFLSCFALGLAVGAVEGNVPTDAIAGGIVGLPLAVYVWAWLRWLERRGRPCEFAVLLAWVFGCCWVLGASGFLSMTALAAAFGNTGSDGILGTGLKIGLGGGVLWGLLLGGLVGTARMVWKARQATTCP